MAKKAYVNDGNDWVELASSNTDLSGYLLESSASAIYQEKVENISSTEISYLNGVSGLIQTQIDGKTTASYVDTAISTSLSGVIDSAPSTLNTLNELAAALGDDPNFATTITEMIANKITSVPGIINQFAGSGSAAPTGWLFCDGQEVLITTYQNLYNSLTSSGTTFPYGANTNGSGGVGSTHFRIPNFKGRVPVGKDSAQTEFDALGETGGAKTHTLTSAEIPAHSHPNTASFTGTGGTTGNDSPDHGHAYGRRTTGAGGDASGTGIPPHNSSPSGPPDDAGPTAGANARHQHSFTPSGTVAMTNANNTGGGGSHNNLQPYITVNYIIKT
jgi:microcystin-dependent protein